MSLAMYKKDVYYHFAYLIIENHVRLDNDFEKTTLLNLLWLQKLQNELPDDPQKTLLHLVHTISNINNAIHVDNIPIYTDEDQHFIDSLHYFFDRVVGSGTYPSKPLVDQFNAFLLKLNSYVVPQTPVPTKNPTSESQTVKKPTPVKTLLDHPQHNFNPV